MRVLALNCGSSSVKSALIDSATGRRLQEIRVENIGSNPVDLQAAVDRVLTEYREGEAASTQPEAVAHRVVHGGEKFQRPVMLDAAVLDQLEQLNALAPLHNPPALAAIRQARTVLPDVPHVAVFDTSFHATLPDHARQYALPVDVSRRLGIRRFGFHGINHSHVASSIASYLDVDLQALRIISCHLGNGASVTAIEAGRSVETSMGMTPLEGLVMGTRPGDIDPGALLQLQRCGEFDADQLDELLNKRSGLKGLTGINDMREIERRAAAGDEDCRRAIDIYVHRIRKYIGAYAVAMNGVDAIAFTAGVGENSSMIRQRCLERLDILGAVLDPTRNRNVRLSDAQPIDAIAADSSRVQLLVVRADEELAIARESATILS
jgi:acetate kinase